MKYSVYRENKFVGKYSKYQIRKNLYLNILKDSDIVDIHFGDLPPNPFVIKNNKKYSFYSALDHEIIKDLKKSGWKTASIMGVFIDSKNNQHPHKTLQCFLHPKSNRVYRFVDAEFIFKEKNNDDIEFYKNETGWPKYINESLEKQNFKVKENDLITYHVKANSNNDLEYTIKEIKKLRSNK